MFPVRSYSITNACILREILVFRWDTGVFSCFYKFKNGIKYTYMSGYLRNCGFQGFRSVSGTLQLSGGVFTKNSRR